MCFPSFHLMELFKLYVHKALCVNLILQESLYCQTFYIIFLSLCMIKFLSNLVFMKELCVILSFLFASNFLHKIKQVGFWGGGERVGGARGWSTRMVENFASSSMGHISHYKNTIQYICQFYWANVRNAQNVLLRFKFTLLGINVTLRN